MTKILISHPIHPVTIRRLGLRLANVSDIFSFPEEFFYRDGSDEEIIYIPNISLKQTPDEQNDPSLDILRQALTVFQPDVLIVGNNAVPKLAIAAWRKAVGYNKNLLIIRRGVDTRAIDKEAARQYQVGVDNLPGINSPYVAQHMSRYLQLYKTELKRKLAIIGTGNIGKNIALDGIAWELDVHLLSPSLQDPHKRQLTLWQRGIPSKKVVCAQNYDRVFENATYVAISVPWENSDGSHNTDIIDEHHIRSLAPNARIVSASVPRIFSERALALMNEWVRQEKIFLRIDTSKRRAQEVKKHYPNIDAAHDVAFASPECQQELDNAMLIKAREFLPTSVWDKVLVG
ncbi:MAG: phosphoglycerate dehydrogenase [Hydrococcus sp. RU_2_2]|jgi:lactate dehydrogenase-like 2-hydroxyacid dehydrogenase|nr:phosphoglycerate dehydrogenase [Hydrococcus sp. RU_2_2]NJP20161.1 phosphoglycerate dehydrogenase [Hydrococcus sp. CRU_1_1]